LENNKNKNKNVVEELGFYEYADKLHLTATESYLRWKCGNGDVRIGAYDGQDLLREIKRRLKVDAFSVGCCFKGVHVCYNYYGYFIS